MAEPLLAARRAPVPVPVPVIDAGRLWEQLGHSRALLVAVVEVFQDESPHQFDALIAAVQSGAPDTIALAAHTLRSALLNVASLRATALAGELEEKARAGRLHGTRELVSALARELVAVSDALHRLVAER